MVISGNSHSNSYPKESTTNMRSYHEFSNDLKQNILNIFSSYDFNTEDMKELAKKRILYTKKLLEYGELDNDEANLILRILVGTLVDAWMEEATTRFVSRKHSRSHLRQLLVPIT